MTSKFQLQLSPDSQRSIEAERMARETKYRRAYWQKYKETHVRVFGTLTKAQHNQIKSIADANDRPVWTQIWAESCAYRRAEFLAAPEIMARQDRMIAELRRIGNNLNQLAKLGHVRALPQGAASVEAEMEALEEMISDFTRRPWTQPKRRSTNTGPNQ